MDIDIKSKPEETVKIVVPETRISFFELKIKEWKNEIDSLKIPETDDRSLDNNFEDRVDKWNEQREYRKKYISSLKYKIQLVKRCLRGFKQNKDIILLIGIHETLDKVDKDLEEFKTNLETKKIQHSRSDQKFNEDKNVIPGIPKNIIKDGRIVNLLGEPDLIIPCNSYEGTRKTEQKLYDFLKLNIKFLFVREQSFEWCRNINPLRFDFVIPDLKLIIELDGAQHYKSVTGRGCFVDNMDRDLKKMKDVNEHGYSVIRIDQEDVWSNKNKWSERLYRSIRKYDYPTNILIGDFFEGMIKYNTRVNVVSSILIEEDIYYRMINNEGFKKHRDNVISVIATEPYKFSSVKESNKDIKLYEKLTEILQEPNDINIIYNISDVGSIYYIYQIAIIISHFVRRKDYNCQCYFEDTWIDITHEDLKFHAREIWFYYLQYLETKYKHSIVLDIIRESIESWKSCDSLVILQSSFRILSLDTFNKPTEKNGFYYFFINHYINVVISYMKTSKKLRERLLIYCSNKSSINSSLTSTQT